MSTFIKHSSKLCKCHLSLLDKVTFYNNSAVKENTCSHVGEAICSYDSIVDTNGSVYFLNNKAQFGGAVYLSNSTMAVSWGLVSFYNNITYRNDGAINLHDFSSAIDINHTVFLKFVNNSALLGGAVYFRSAEKQSNFKDIS